MPHTNGSNEPAVILQATDVSWTRSVSGYDSATSDTITYVFSKEDGTDTDIPTVTTTPITDQLGWDVAITDADTTLMDAGIWVWQLTATTGGIITSIDTGFTEVVAAAGTGVDMRPLECQIHEAILVALGMSDANVDISSYSIGDRNLSYYSPDELQSQEAYYGQLCRRKREAITGKNSSKVVSFFP